MVRCGISVVLPSFISHIFGPGYAFLGSNRWVRLAARSGRGTGVAATGGQRHVARFIAVFLVLRWRVTARSRHPGGVLPSVHAVRTMSGCHKDCTPGLLGGFLAAGVTSPANGLLRSAVQPSRPLTLSSCGGVEDWRC